MNFVRYRSGHHNKKKIEKIMNLFGGRKNQNEYVGRSYIKVKGPSWLKILTVEISIHPKMIFVDF